MARATTILTMSLVAVTALANGGNDFIIGGASVEENESGFEGLRQSVTRSLLDVEAVVGKTPFQQQQQRRAGTSVAIIAASITPAPTPILHSRQLPAPLPNPGGGGRNNPPPNPDGGAAQSALASLSAQSSSDVSKASSEGFVAGSSVASAQASSQIASISSSLAASLSSAIASITATATPGQQLPPTTVTVTQTVNPTAPPGQQPPTTITVTQIQTEIQTQTQIQTQTVNQSLISTPMTTTMTMNAAQPTKPDLLPVPPTTSNALISDPTKDPNQVDLTVSQLAAIIVGTIIATALAAVFFTLLFTRFAQRRKSGQVCTIGPDDSGSQTALRPAYVGDEKASSVPPTEEHPAVRTKSHASKPSQSSRTSAYDERPSAGAETAGFGFGPFNWSNVRNSIFGGSRSQESQGSRPDSQQVEVRTAHKRTISNGSKPRLIRLGSRDDRLTPVTEGSRESPSAAGKGGPPGRLNPPSGPPSRQPSNSPLNLNPPNAPFRNPSGDAVSWGSWGAMVENPKPEGHMAVLLKEPPRHQHNLSASSSGSSKIMDANQLKAAMMADGTIEPPLPTRQPSKHERRPSSGTLGVMGGASDSISSGRLDGPPSMPHPLPRSPSTSSGNSSKGKCSRPR
ncbi:hypothetical protein PG987_013004 [Apiospora arundinis]